MDFTSESIRSAEEIALVTMGMLFAASHFLGEKLSRMAIGVTAAFHLLIIAFRSVDYNSDTRNYASYVELLRDSQGYDFWLVSKFEPLHLLTAAVAGSMEGWLLLESLVAFGSVLYLLIKIEKMEVLAVILGCTMPLISSSVRFAVGILVIASLSIAFSQNRNRFLILLVSSVCAHISLLVMVLLRWRSWLFTLIPVVCLIIAAFLIDNVGERSGIINEGEYRVTGVRTLVAAVLFMGMFRYYCARAASRPNVSDVACLMIIFLTTALGFPNLNRWIVLYLIVLTLAFEAASIDYNNYRKTRAFTSFLIYFALVAPSIIASSEAISSQSW